MYCADFILSPHTLELICWTLLIDRNMKTINCKVYDLIL